MIVDVDSHWETTEFPPGEDPFEPWRENLPRGIGRLAHAMAGDLLDRLPEADRPAPKELLPGLVAAAKSNGGPVILHPLHDSTALERVAWMDRVGIDHCLVNPGGYWQSPAFLGRDRPVGVRRCNDYLTENCRAIDELSTTTRAVMPASIAAWITRASDQATLALEASVRAK